MATPVNSKAAGTWSISGDWTSAAVPLVGDDVTLSVFSNTVTTMLLTALSTPSLNSLAVTASTKNVTLTMSAGATLNVAGNIGMTTVVNVSTFSARIQGSGTINQTVGIVSGNGTIAATGGTTLVLNATSLNSSVVFLASTTSSILDLNLSSNANTIQGMGVANSTNIRLNTGVLTVAALNTGAQTGTINVTGGTLNVTAATAMTSNAELLTVSGGTLDLKAGGSLGSAGITLRDVAGGAVRIGGSLTAGTVTFVAGGTSSQILFDDLGTALVGRTISGFAGNDRIRVTGATSYKVLSGGGTASGTIGAIDSGGGTIEVLTVSGGQTLASDNTVISGATLTASAACYLAGTKIQTVAGDVAVEDLTVGDLLVTAGAGSQAVRWIGQRAYLARLVNAHHRAGLMPIQISAGALADNVPARDLFVSPEHMMVLDGHLVAAHRLVNGSTITRLEDIDVVKYFHIELDQHSVIFAEGAPSESYLDTGNRNMFTNVLDYAEIGAPVGSTVACLPIVSEGPVLAAIRGVIADRAEANGFTTSADADLHLLVDGAVVYPSMIAGNSYSFDIAEPDGEIRIVSRSVVPAELDAASADRRQLGVAVSVLTLRGNGLSVDVLAGEKLLADGFYPADGGHRWTNGSAQFPTALLALMHGAFSLTVQLVATGLRYPVAGRGDVVALASARGPRVAGDQRRVA